MKNKLIKVNNLNSILNSPKGPVYVLNDICYEITKGRTVGLIGESGSGKTQLCLASTGMQDLTPGVIEGQSNVSFGDEVIDIYPKDLTTIKNIYKDLNENYKRVNEFNYKKRVKKNTEKLKKNMVGWIPQDTRNFLNPFWKIDRLFKESYNLLKYSNSENSYNDINSFIRYYLEQVDLKYDDVKNKYPHEMSGGECQRAMIAFVLSKQPEFIIADETTTGLDVSRQKRVIDLFKTIKKNNPDLTIILVSHDFGFLDHLVDEYLVMYGGFVIEHIADKNRLKDTPDQLHPYTQDLLSRLFKNQKDNTYDELASNVDLHNKLNSCPYKFSCKFIGNGESYEDKCNNKLPPISGKMKNNSEEIDLSDNWIRCWKDEK